VTSPRHGRSRTTTPSPGATRCDRKGIAALQGLLTQAQKQVTGRLATDQAFLLAALLAVVAIVAVITATGAVIVRRWLLRPLTAVRQAAKSVAAGDHDTTVPAAGPAELSDLGRATELMRTRLVAALAEEERAERRFRGLFEAGPDAMLAVAADGSMVMANQQAEHLFGYGSAELIGHPVMTLIPPADRTPTSGAGNTTSLIRTVCRCTPAGPSRWSAGRGRNSRSRSA